MIAVRSLRWFSQYAKSSFLILTALSLTACGGGGGGNDEPGDPQPTRHSLGGTVSGLTGSAVLQNNGGDAITVSADGPFRFTTPLAVGQSYQVSVASQPVNQQCVVTTGSGVMGSGAISDVAINCATTLFTVRGTVSGLTGTVVLRNNGGDELALSADGNFFFPTTLAAGSAYQVSVQTHPGNQHCTVAAGSGTMVISDVSGVTVTCVAASRLSGTIAGLAGTMVLQNNATDDLTVATNGSFTFATPLLAGATYQVSVLTQPQTRQCNVTSGSGTMGSTDVTNISVSCVPKFSVGGAITGLVGSVVLRNGTDDLTVHGDGSFTFGASLTSGASYAVSFLSASDPTQQCFVSSGTGTINSADVATVSVTCTGKFARYRAESYEAFTSLNGTSNLEGTWILLAEGTLSRGYQVAGINPRQDYQLWSRAMVRIRRDPLDPTKYFVLTCGPGGSRNEVTTPVGTTFFVPYYSASTTLWSNYGVTIVDATTMQRNSVSRAYSFTGNGDGLVMGWNLSWVLKRISDDPFAATATVRDNLAAQADAANCIYESEGTYVATENDGVTETQRINGLFYWTDAYQSHPSQLFDNATSYYSRFSLKDELGFRTFYRGSDPAYTYRSTDDAQISTLRHFSGAASSHAVEATSADALETDDDTLDILL